MKEIFVPEPDNKKAYTDKNDALYSAFAGVYDAGVKIFPLWQRWLKAVLPHIEGPRVLEVSFGTGYLLMQYAAQYETYGIDYNRKFVGRLRKKLVRRRIPADIRQGDVEELPYEKEFFNTVVNTMAFTGYPDGQKAMSELHRVLKTGGNLVMVDVGYPADRNFMGMLMAKGWIAAGDIVREMAPLFEQFEMDFRFEEIGGFGSVHLYVAQKR